MPSWLPLPESVTCPECGRTSFHPKDIAEGYCGNCHDWTGVPVNAGSPVVVVPDWETWWKMHPEVNLWERIRGRIALALDAYRDGPP